jgi:hypothetical protein
MNTKGLLRMGVPLGPATTWATDFAAKFIRGGGDKSRRYEEFAAILANLLVEPDEQEANSEG